MISGEGLPGTFNGFCKVLVKGDTVDGRNPAPPGMYKTL